MIKQRTFGRTGLRLSELCLGTLNFGWKIDENQSLAVLDRYHEAGGNFIQSTGHATESALAAASTRLSEEIVGRWLQSRRIVRDSMVLGTRIRVRRPDDSPGALAKSLMQKCRESTDRLQAGQLDIVVIEWNDGMLPVSETLAAFDQLVRGGFARYIVAANFPGWRVADTLGRAYERSQPRMEALQADYSLVTRARFEPEVMTMCREHRLGFFACSPLAGGFLARSYDRSSLRGDWIQRHFGTDYNRAVLSAVSEVARRNGTSVPQAALSWVLANPQVTSAVIGVQSRAQLDDLLGTQVGRLGLADYAGLAEASVLEEVRLPAEALARQAAYPELLEA